MRRIYKILAGASVTTAAFMYFYRRWKLSEAHEETLPPPMDEETRAQAYEAFAMAIGKTYFGHTMPVWKPVYVEPKQTFADHYEYIICIRIDETPWMGMIRFSKTHGNVVGCSPWIASYPRPPEQFGDALSASTMANVLETLRKTYQLPENVSIANIRRKGCFRRLDGSHVSHYHLTLNDQGGYDFSVDDDGTVFNAISDAAKNI